MLNSNSLSMCVRLLNSCKAENGGLQIETTKMKLRELWGLETSSFGTLLNIDSCCVTEDSARGRGISQKLSMWIQIFWGTLLYASWSIFLIGKVRRTCQSKVTE